MNDNHAAEVETSIPWTLTEDWALIDKVSKFTVGTSSQTRTFWVQLALSTPELSRRCGLDVAKRFQEILSDPEKNGHSPLKLPEAGPSPPLLQNWWMDGKGMVSGVVDGNTIWFPMQCTGYLADDPAASLVGADNSDIMIASGGFVEAVGGRIFELGQSRSVPTMQSASSVPAIEIANDIDDSKPGERDNLFPDFPFVAFSTASLSALVATSILTACIGFSSGLSVVASKSTPTNTVRSNTVSQIHTVEKFGAGGTPTISEMRARQEARVLQERRVISSIQEKLAKDEAKLAELQQQESLQSQPVPVKNENR